MSTLAGGLLQRDHTLTVPVDWSDPHRFGSIDLFVREVVDPGRDRDDLPALIFLQGGPGGAGPRPATGGWLATATKTHRVFLLDQRGTGRSTPVTARTIEAFPDGEVAADYLLCFRADSIVADAEHIRSVLWAGQQWASLGQSYGGFITLTYLSRHPQALTAAYVTGGLPGISADAPEVYRRTFDLQLARNRELARRFPDDVTALGLLADRSAAGGLLLPTGEELTPERVQLLGMGLGMSTGVDGVHWLLDGAFDPDGEPRLGFLASLGQASDFAGNPLYAVLHESIYHQGAREPGWAAAAEYSARPEFAANARPLQLTGEAIFPWMYEQIPALRPFAAAADALADRTEYGELYDPQALARNEVPVAAIQYVTDPYVDLDLALETSRAVGNVQVWATNEYLHDGLRVAGDVILPRLMDLAAGRWQISQP